VNPTARTRTRPAGLRLVAAVAGLTLAVAACGGDDDDAAEAPPATESMSTEPMDDTMTTEPMDDTMTTEPMDDTMTTEPMDDTMTTEPMDDMMSEPSGPGCAAVPADGEGSFGGMADDPAATAASNNPVLSTLVGAVTQAGLVDTLNSEGPFTIFAPTNDAFAAVPPADLEAVLADTDLLTSVLTYHVVAGESLSSDELVEAGTVTTVNGADLTIADEGGTLTVNGVPAVCIDVPTSNATVHIVGGVLLPPT